MGGRSVFISYRRQLSWQLAQLVRDNLVEHDFDTFVDIKNLDSGEFDRKILGQIETREHFIVLLQPGSLDRIGEKGDWLRREIAHALRRGRNVVPVTADGFKFPRDLALPPDVERLPSFQAVTVERPEYFNAAMKLLRKRFLKMPSRPAASSVPETRSVVEPGRHPLASPEALWNAKFSVPVLPAPVLTSSDPVTLIVTALAAGAVTGMTESAASAVKDAYTSLRALVRKRLAGQHDAELVLTRHETAPDTWQAPLVAVLEQAGAEHDTDLVAAAQALMSQIDKAGARAGKYTVDTRGAYGVQIGDHNRQDNVFRAPPGG